MLLGAAWPGRAAGVLRSICSGRRSRSAASYVAATSVNDIADADVDRINHPGDRARPLVTGDASERDLWRLHLLACCGRARRRRAARLDRGRPSSRLARGRDRLLAAAAPRLVPHLARAARCSRSRTCPCRSRSARSLPGGSLVAADAWLAGGALGALPRADRAQGLSRPRGRRPLRQADAPAPVRLDARRAPRASAALVAANVLLFAAVRPPLGARASRSRRCSWAIAVLLLRLHRARDCREEQVAIGLGARLGNGLLHLPARLARARRRGRDGRRRARRFVWSLAALFLGRHGRARRAARAGRDRLQGLTMRWQPGDAIVRRDVWHGDVDRRLGRDRRATTTDDLLALYMPERQRRSPSPPDFFGAPHPWSGRDRWQRPRRPPAPAAGRDALPCGSSGKGRRRRARRLVREHPGAVAAHPLGFDTQDLELDIVVSPDGTWQLQGRRAARRRGSSAAAGRARRSPRSGPRAPRLGAELDAGRRWWSDEWATWEPDPAWTPAACSRRLGCDASDDAVWRDVHRGRVWRAQACRIVAGSRRRWLRSGSPPARRRRFPAAVSASPATTGSSSTRPRRAAQLCVARPGRAALDLRLLGLRVGARSLVRELRAAAAALPGRLRHLRREARPDRRSADGTLPLEGRGRARAGRRARAARRGGCPRRGAARARRVAVPDGLGGLAPRSGLAAPGASRGLGTWSSRDAALDVSATDVSQGQSLGHVPKRRLRRLRPSALDRIAASRLRPGIRKAASAPRPTTTPPSTSAGFIPSTKAWPLS